MITIQCKLGTYLNNEGVIIGVFNSSTVGMITWIKGHLVLYS